MRQLGLYSCVLIAACAGQKSLEPEVIATSDCFNSLATALSTDAMQGRGIGTDGLDAASRLVEQALKDAIGGAGTVQRQTFDVMTGVALDSDNALATGTDHAITADWSPYGWSSSGAFTGTVVFAGYGISAPDLSYDDYEGVDVSGKIVLAMRFEPGEDDADSPFDGRRPSRYSDLRRKALTAREAGASALVLVTPANEDDEPDKLPALRVDGPTSTAGLPVLHITRATADAWLASDDLTLASLRAQIETTGTPNSRSLGLSAAGTIDLTPTTSSVSNIVAIVPGTGLLADEAVVVGAHYDHLGMGGEGSLRPGETAIHNGADDNASGTAAMVCSVPEALAVDGDRRTLIAIGFTAEEIGLGGSAYYVDNALFPLENTVAMVNLDMVGRVRDGHIRVLGSDTSVVWDDIVTAAAEPAGLIPDLGGDGYGPSDQTSFYAKGMPVLHLFTGAHDEYHTPDDDIELLNLEGGAQVTALTAGILSRTLTLDSRPDYIASTNTPIMAGDARGFGAYLGTVPDYTTMAAEDGGVLLSDVRGGGPADLAGLRGGDVIIDIGGVGIENLYDMTYVLRDRRPGDSVGITVVRDGENVEFLATLGRRGETSESGNSPHGTAEWTPAAGTDASALLDAKETHLADLRQLTFGGENAEAYWSPDGQSLIYQATPAEGGCDQQFVMDLNTGEKTLVSSGEGRTTCGYYTYPEGNELLWATTRFDSTECPAPPDRSQGYVWPLYDFDLVRTVNGETERFLSSDGYDAEATVCMTDGRIVFTSDRDGDLELYSANADGSHLTRLTNTPGYDGGAFFTPDCSEIIWRASRPEGDALTDYQRLLETDLVRPSQLEIFRMNADGTNVVQLTDNGAANFGPYPMPDASGVIFASNVGDSPREFDLFHVGRDGGELEQITYTEQFDGFPMFSPNGEWLVFGSNRGGDDGSTNLFIGRWVE
jgi:Tol biopolymer transport system component